MNYTESDIRDLRASGHWPAADDTETPQDAQETSPTDDGKGKGKPTDAASVPA